MTTKQTLIWWINYWPLFGFWRTKTISWLMDKSEGHRNGCYRGSEPSRKIGQEVCMWLYTFCQGTVVELRKMGKWQKGREGLEEGTVRKGEKKGKEKHGRPQILEHEALPFISQKLLGLNSSKRDDDWCHTKYAKSSAVNFTRWNKLDAGLHTVNSWGVKLKWVNEQSLTYHPIHIWTIFTGYTALPTKH